VGGPYFEIRLGVPPASNPAIMLFPSVPDAGAPAGKAFLSADCRRMSLDPASGTAEKGVRLAHHAERKFGIVKTESGGAERRRDRGGTSARFGLCCAINTKL
jgi:hypothetical protein